MPSRASRLWQRAVSARCQSRTDNTSDIPAELPNLGIIEFAESEDWCGLRLYPRQRDLLSEFWNDRFTTAVWALGRRSGKTTLSAISALYAATIRAPRYRSRLRPGEKFYVLSVGNAQSQSRIAFQFVADLVERSSRLSKLEISRTADSLELSTGAVFRALPASSRSGRGLAVAVLILDEIAHALETGGNSSGDAIYRALSPAVAQFQPYGRIMAISSPAGRTGIFWELFKAAANSSDIQAVRLPTWKVNPILPENCDFLRREKERNPELFRSEYAAEFTGALNAYFSRPEVILLHASGCDRAVADTHLEGYPRRQVEAIVARPMVDPIVERDTAGDAILDEYGHPILAPWFRGSDADRWICCVDPGLSHDSFGLAIGANRWVRGRLYPEIALVLRWTVGMFDRLSDRTGGKIRRRSFVSGVPEAEEKLHPGQVDFRAVADFILKLREDFGFRQIEVFTDLWNFGESRQRLQNFDIQVGLQRSEKKHFDSWRSLMLSNQLRYRVDRIWFEEALRLEYSGTGKVTSPRLQLGEGDAKTDAHADICTCLAMLCGILENTKDYGAEYALVEHGDLTVPAAESTKVGEAIGLDRISSRQAELAKEFGLLGD